MPDWQLVPDVNNRVGDRLGIDRETNAFKDDRKPIPLISV